MLRSIQGTGGNRSKEVHQSAQGWISLFGFFWDLCLFWVFPAEFLRFSFARFALRVVFRTVGDPGGIHISCTSDRHAM